jgi:hypothetical protein
MRSVDSTAAFGDNSVLRAGDATNGISIRPKM